MVLRVLQVITDPTRRGAQLFALDLGEALERADLSVRTVALAVSSGSAELDVPVLGTRRVGWSALVALRRELARADVAIAHGGQTLPACALATLTIRTPFVYRQISDSRFWASTPARRFRVRAGLARAARVVALWEGAATTLRRHFGVPDERLRVIPNAVVAPRFSPATTSARVDARREFGLDAERLTVVYCGALVVEKGVDVAVEAVGRCPGAQLLVAGDGPEAEALRSLARRVAPGRVAFTGSLGEPAAAYSAADVVVLVSRAGDSMPAVLIEAALMELPALATPVEAIPEIVVHGKTGELVPVGDVDALAAAIDALAAGRDRVTTLGRAARAHCLERYSIERVGGMWAEQLRDVVTG